MNYAITKQSLKRVTITCHSELPQLAVTTYHNFLQRVTITLYGELWQLVSTLCKCPR